MKYITPEIKTVTVRIYSLICTSGGDIQKGSVNMETFTETGLDW